MKAMELALIVSVGLLAASSPESANAGSSEEKMSSMVSIDGLRGPSTPKGVVDEELDSIHLAKEIPSMGNRRLRARRVTIAPGGIVPIHSHADRPAMLYVLQGTIVEHRSDREQPIVHAAGDLSVEADVAHWWENRGEVPVVIVATDIVLGDGGSPTTVMKANAAVEFDGPSTPKTYGARILGTLDLATQIDGVESRELRLRLVTVKAGGIAPVHSHADRPALFYILEGEITENRSDAQGSVERKMGDVTKAEGGVAHWWKNDSDSDVTILVTDIFNTAGAGQEG